MLSKGLDDTLRMMKRSGYSRMPKNISDLLRWLWTEELKNEERKTTEPTPIEHTPNPRKIKKGLEKLGKTKHLQVNCNGLQRDGNYGQG